MGARSPEWATTPRQADRSGLLLTADSGSPQSWPVDEKSCYTIGRNGYAVNICVVHKSVSRVHACLAYNAAGELLLVDLGSAHGTKLNGKRLEKNGKALINEGDSFTVAACPTVFKIARRNRPEGPVSRWEDDCTEAAAAQQDTSPSRGDVGAGRAGTARNRSPVGRRCRVRSRSRERSRSGEPGRRRRSRSRNLSPDRHLDRRRDGRLSPHGGGGGHSRLGRRSRSPVPRRRSPIRQWRDERNVPKVAEEQRQPQAAFTEPPPPAANPIDIVRSMMGGPAGGSGLDAAQKKKLLWGSKKAAAPATAARAGANRWDTAQFANEADKDKFQRLMGVKQTAATAPAHGASEEPQLFDRNLPAREQQEQMKGELERNFLEGVRRGNRHTVGLGL